MAYRRIGVVGATGRLGSEVTRAFKDEGFDVVPFSRRQTTVAGIPTQKIETLVNFDVILSTVDHHGVADQLELIDKAKRDGVKRFIPAEFGMDHRFTDEPLWDQKRGVLNAVQDAEFPDGWNVVAAGFFDAIVPFIVKIDKVAGTVTVPGSGKKQFPFIRRYDIGRALAATFREPQKYKDQWLLLAGDWKSMDEVATIVQSKSSVKLEVKHVPVSANTPVLRLVEETDGNVFNREMQTNLPIKLKMLEEYIQDVLELA